MKFNSLTQIQKFLQCNILGSLEQKRIEDDFSQLLDRLRKRKYKIGYTAINQYDIPGRTREFFDHFASYASIGRIWADILKKTKIQKFSCIADLCPGFAPKVELGLFYLGYRGEVVLLDKKVSSMRQLETFLHIIHPQFRITKKKIDLFRPPCYSYELLVGNHIIDDLVLSYFCKKWRLPSGRIYTQEGYLTSLWERIVNRKKRHIDEIVPKIAHMFETMTKKGSLILFSQYQSYIEKLLGMQSVTKFNKDVARALVAHLGKRGFHCEKRLFKNPQKENAGYLKKGECYILHRR